MSKTGKRLLVILVLCTLIISLPIPVTANSAEPPAVVILVNNPPPDLSIALITQDTTVEASVRLIAWEGYYVFYARDMKTSSQYTFAVTTGEKSFECTLDGALERYNNVFTLNLSKQELKYGKSPLRASILVSLRVLITLMLEGIIFWLFGFRDKRSWIVFLVINLITQGVLNLWLNLEASPMPSSYLIFGLFFGEIIVFATEMITFPIFIKEYKRVHCVIYAFIANLISLIIGGYIITRLPV